MLLSGSTSCHAVYSISFLLADVTDFGTGIVQYFPYFVLLFVMTSFLSLLPVYVLKCLEDALLYSFPRYKCLIPNFPLLPSCCYVLMVHDASVLGPDALTCL